MKPSTSTFLGRPSTGVALAWLFLLAAPLTQAQTLPTCEAIGGTCRPYTMDLGCESGEQLDRKGTCDSNLKCCGSTSCEDRGGACQPNVGACAPGTSSLGNASCSTGLCCTLPTDGPTCGELVGNTDGRCIQSSDSCPAGYTNLGPTKDPCLSCCSPGPGPGPTPTPTPGGSEYKVEFLHTDALGSVRMVTDQAGEAVSRSDYYPFGESIHDDVNGRGAVDNHYSEDPTLRQRFTGKERDGESRLDYFGARYYLGVQGRFLSPDEWVGGTVDAFTGAEVSAPGPLPYGDVADPQTSNKYAYVRNNPLRYTDLTGHCPWCIPMAVGAGTSVITGAMIRGLTGQPVFDRNAIAVDAALGAVGAGLAGKAARLAQLAGFAKLENAAAKARYLGAFGEEAGGAATTGKEAFRAAAGKLRYADNAAGAAEVLEVKNVATITSRNAAQIADEAAHAAATGRSMVLAVRGTTDVTRVQGLISAGAVQTTILRNVAEDGLRLGLFRSEAAVLGVGVGSACNIRGPACVR